MLQKGKMRLTFVDGYVLETSVKDFKLYQGTLTLPDGSILKFDNYIELFKKGYAIINYLDEKSRFSGHLLIELEKGIDITGSYLDNLDDKEAVKATCVRGLMCQQFKFMNVLVD